MDKSIPPEMTVEKARWALDRWQHFRDNGWGDMGTISATEVVGLGTEAKGYLECHKQVERLVEAARKVKAWRTFPESNAFRWGLDELEEALKPFLTEGRK